MRPRNHRRLKGHLFPFNSGLLAREALSHPFFGAGVPSACTPVCMQRSVHSCGCCLHSLTCHGHLPTPPSWPPCPPCPLSGAGNVRHATVPIPVTNCRWHEEGSGEMLARLPTSATVVAAEPALVHARTA